MIFEHNPEKSASNQQKHGLPLEAAKDFDWKTAVLIDDKRYDYGEDRVNAFGYIGNHIYCLTFTERNGIIRVISLRRANKREIQRYVTC